MWYVEFPKIKWPHTFTTYPTTSRRTSTLKKLVPDTIPSFPPSESTGTTPKIHVHKNESIKATQVKQLKQTTEPVVPQTKWNTDSIELNEKVHKLPITKDYMLKKYSDIFKDVGALPGRPYHIRQKKQYLPVQHSPRSVPVAMQSTYKVELHRLVKEGIYVMDVTPWCRESHSMVTHFQRCRLDNSINSAHGHQPKGMTVLWRWYS